MSKGSSIGRVAVALLVLSPAVGAAGEKIFDKQTLREKPCKLLSAAQVAEAAKLPADQVEENPGMRCLFSMPEGRVLVRSQVHKKIERAKRHFENVTRDVTAEELRQQKQLLQERLKEKEAKGEVKKGTASNSRVLLPHLPEEAITHRRIAGLGDGAAVDNEGKVHVLFGNVTFQVAAQKGKKDLSDPDLSEKLAERVVGNLEKL